MIGCIPLDASLANNCVLRFAIIFKAHSEEEKACLFRELGILSKFLLLD